MLKHEGEPSARWLSQDALEAVLQTAYVLESDIGTLQMKENRGNTVRLTMKEGVDNLVRVELKGSPNPQRSC